MEHTVIGSKVNVQIGATGEEEILQNVKTIVATLQSSVPLDRSFARPGEVLDNPSNKAVAAETASIYRAIKKYEPRVEVVDVSFVQENTGSMEGVIKPRVKIRIKQGVL